MNPPPSRRSSPLSRDEVVETALALTRRVGLNGLTMRGLAAELGRMLAMARDTGLTGETALRR